MKLWKGADGDRKPELVEHPKNYSSNEYFQTETEAWEHIRDCAAAGVRLAGSDVERRRRELHAAEQRAADACVEYREVEDNYRKWQMEHHQVVGA
jgi:hypothetical protein